MIRVIIVDDHPMVSVALKDLLEMHDQFEVVASYDNGGAALAAARTMQPDLLVVDLMVPVLGGVEVISRLRAGGAQFGILVVSGGEPHESGLRALRAGANGFVHKTDAMDEIAMAAMVVARGKSYFSQELLALAGDGQADGRPYSWTFARDATHAWSLTTGSTPTLVPELPGIAVLPTLGFAAAEDAQRVVFDRLAAMRGEASRCEASHPISPDCRDAWVAAVDSELTVGPGPGFGLRGDTRGLMAGVDRAMPSGEGLAFRAGAHAGVLRGNHTTAGGGHEDLRIGAARLRTSTPLAGFHASIAGTGGRTVEATLDAQRSRTRVFTGDGWFDTFTGSRLALRMQATQRFAAHGWALEPLLALGLVAQQWGDRYDAGGRDVLVGDDVVGQARIGLRVERTWAAWRPWATLAVEDTFGEGREALRLRGTAGETFALPGHDLRHGGTLEAGLEGRLPGGLQVFGSVTMGERGSGTSVSRRSATLGARWAW